MSIYLLSEVENVLHYRLSINLSLSTATEQKFSLKKTFCLAVPLPLQLPKKDSKRVRLFLPKLREFLDELVKSTFQL